MSTEWLPQVNQRKCTACGDCIAICPTGALGWQTGNAAVLHPELCTYCAVCEEVCPVSAIELPYLIVKGKSKESEEM